MSEMYIPSYINVGSSEVSKLLQKLNITATKEIEMFKQLCQLNQSKINYRDALAATNTKDEEFIFTNFIQKIEKYQIAVLRTEILETVLQPIYIRLTDESSVVYYKEYIIEQIHQAVLSPIFPLPTLQNFKKTDILISKGHYTPISLELFINAYKTCAISFPDIADDVIYSFPLPSKEIFLFTMSTVPYLCKICITRIQNLLQDQNLLLNISSTINIPTNELQGKIEDNNILMWDELSSILYKKFDMLQGNSLLSNYLELFDLITLLHHTIKPKIQQMKEIEEYSLLLSSFHNTILQKMKSYNETILHNQFIDLLKTQVKSSNISPEKTESAIDDFFENYVVANNKSQSLENDNFIIQVNQWYLHTSLVIKIISEQYAPLTKKLTDYYTKSLAKYLLKKLPPSEIVFFDEESLEISVHQKVTEFDELYAQILKMPVFLASILSKSKTNTSSKSTLSDLPVSKKIALFFNLRTKTLLPWHEIFNLRLTTMVEEAYTTLPLVKKIIFLFTGRYKMMKEKIIKVQLAYSTMRPSLLRDTSIAPLPQLKIKK